MTSATEDAVVLLQQVNVWYRDGRFAEAEEACAEALALDPGNPDALNLLGMCLNTRGETGKAVHLLRRAARIEQSGRMWSNLGVVLSSNREYVAAITAYRQAVRLDPNNVTNWTNLLFAMDHHPEASPALRMADRRAFNAVHCAALTAASAPHENDRDPDRRLKVGYVSADFRNHSASIGFGPAIFGHSTDVEVFLYDNNTLPPDQDTVRFIAAADHHQYVYDLSDAQLAEQIRADGIDILVDLSGYSAGGRLLTFARKPAPIQITGWGHAVGTGLDCMDYLVSDAVSLPPEHQHQYRERIMRLPILMGFDARPPFPEVAAPPAERNGYVTFGYLGRAYKLNEHCLAVWAEIMRRLPTSRLILKSNEYSNQVLREWVLSVLASLGVDPSRVSMRGSTTRMIHLQTWNEVDVHLDPWPVGGGITTLEACLMGVPTVTMLGDYVSGRFSASVLTEIGPMFGISANEYEYIENTDALIAVDGSVVRRQEIRDTLLGSIMCDHRAYAQSFEDACRVAWREWCAS